MKSTKSQRDKINLVFSSFLVIGYIICAYFFSSLADALTGKTGDIVRVLILVVFGLLLFYATRVGEGKQIKRFSLAVLLLVDLPALYIILASLFPNLPLSSYINPTATSQTAAIMQTSAGPSLILLLACVALGYALPYTFFSGYEMAIEEETELTDEQKELLKGGLADELAESAEEETEIINNTEADEVKEDAQEAQKAVEDAAEEADEAVTEAADADEVVTEAADEAAEDSEETKEAE